MGGAEERLGRGRPPVEEKPSTLEVGEPESPDVHGFGVVGRDHAAQAQVEAEAAQRAQTTLDPLDLLVAVHGLAPDAHLRPQRGLEAAGQVGDRPFERGGELVEVLLVAGYQGRGCLRHEMLGQVERAGEHGPTSSDPVLRPAP